MKQYRVVATCDENYIADALHALASAYENDLDEKRWYEVEHGCMFIEEIKED